MNFLSVNEAWLCLPTELMARLARSGPADAAVGLRPWAARAGPDLERQAESLTAALEGKADKRAIARELAAQPIRSGTDLEAGVLFGSQETPSLLVLLVGLRPTALRSRRARARAGVTFASLR